MAAIINNEMGKGVLVRRNSTTCGALYKDRHCEGVSRVD